MEKTKPSKIQSFKSRFIKHKKYIFVIIGILFILTAILGFYNNFYMWFWSDFFLSILLLIVGLLFLPFTYKLQEKYLGTNVFTSSLFTVFMYLFFVFSSFSILLSIFQRDLTITVGSIVYFLIILLWRSSVLPITAVKRKKYVGKNILLRRKGIFIFFIILNILVVIFDIFPYINGSSNSKNNNIETRSNQKYDNSCYSSHKKLHNDDRIDVYITKANNGGKINQDNFNIENIKNLEYYIGGKSVNKQYYFNREICNTDKNEIILPIMHAGGMPVDEIYPGAEGGSVGNTSSFANLDFEKGNYTINVFVSDNDSDRDFVYSKTFEVK